MHCGPWDHKELDATVMTEQEGRQACVSKIPTRKTGKFI